MEEKGSKRTSTRSLYYRFIEEEGLKRKEIASKEVTIKAGEQIEIIFDLKE